MSFVLPDIISAGVFDMSLRFPNQKSTPSRITNSFEIELPIKNGGELYLDDKCYGISSDNIYCIKPGTVRHTSNEYNCYYVHIVAEKGEIYDVLTGLPTIINIQFPEQLHNTYTNIIMAFNSTKLKNTIFMYSEILRLINILCKASTEIKKLSLGRNDAVVKALEYLNNNYLEEISLNDLANHVHLSPMYFRNLFVSEMGISPRMYLLNKRIRCAKQLLELNCSSMSEVALSSGFSSQSYFNYVFKKHTGMTPKQYKINNNNLYFQNKHQ